MRDTGTFRSLTPLPPFPPRRGPSGPSAGGPSPRGAHLAEQKVQMKHAQNNNSSWSSMAVLELLGNARCQTFGIGKKFDHSKIAMLSLISGVHTISHGMAIMIGG